MVEERSGDGPDAATRLFARHLVRLGSERLLDDADGLRAATARVLAAFDLDPAGYDAYPVNLYGQGYKLDEAETHSLERAVLDLAAAARAQGCAFVHAAPAGYNGYASRATSGFIVPFLVGGLASPDGTFSQGALVAGRGLTLVPRSEGASSFADALERWCASAPRAGGVALPPAALASSLDGPPSERG